MNNLTKLFLGIGMMLLGVFIFGTALGAVRTLWMLTPMIGLGIVLFALGLVLIACVMVRGIRNMLH
jgi:hypothetical protein